MSNETKRLMKTGFEQLRPDLDHYRKTSRLASVARVYKEFDRNIKQEVYKADVRILNNDFSEDENEPLLTAVPLATGAFLPRPAWWVVVEFLRGDPSAPIITQIMAVGTKNLSGFLLTMDGGASIATKYWNWTKVTSEHH